MKKIIPIVLVLLLSGCAVAQKEWSQSFSYKDPQTIGGRWTVHFPDGSTYENAKCTYWGYTRRYLSMDFRGWNNADPVWNSLGNEIG